MALPVGARAPELPLGDLAAVFPSEALVGDVLSEALGGWDEAFSLPIPQPSSELPALPEAFAELALPAMPMALASVTPERWLAMAQAQGVLQLSAQPTRPVSVTALQGDPQRPAEVAAPMPPAPAPAGATVVPVPGLANLATAVAPRAIQAFESPSAAVARTPPEAVGRQAAAVATAVTAAVALPSGLGSTGEPAPEVGTLQSTAVAGPAVAGPNAATRASHPVVAAPTPPPTLEARWGAHMLLALRDRVQVQIQQRVQHATIRLDPPHLGSLHVSISHEAGRVDVHISATQGDTARLLGQAGERLRQELAEQHPGQVSVSVSAEGQGRQPSRQPLWWADPERPAASREDSHTGHGSHTAQGGDVWVTV